MITKNIAIRLGLPLNFAEKVFRTKIPIVVIDKIKPNPDRNLIIIRYINDMYSRILPLKIKKTTINTVDNAKVMHQVIIERFK